MLVDHLLREGLYDTAKMLAIDFEIADLTNVEVFIKGLQITQFFVIFIHVF
jgi:hypothetical protein